MKLEILPGWHIEKAAEEAIALAKRHHKAVLFDFNGVVVEACAGDEVSTVVDRWKALAGIPLGPDKPFHPNDCVDALARWDKGEPQFVIEVGGLGPGYEQAIYILVFELLRDYIGKPLPTKENWREWGNETVHRIDEKCGGFSGAQVGAAKQVAHRALRDGWGKMVESIPEDRKIQVSNFFPHL